MKQKKQSMFAAEADLCAAFIAALPRGWTAFAETANWDILLVRDEDGFQIGVQAKLRLNVEVLDQALEESGRYHAERPGPDCRAVLVPADAPGRLGRICAYAGLTVITVSASDRRTRRPEFYPRLPKRDDWSDDWHELAPARRHALPEYVPDVRAGSSAPLQLTEWKIKALKIVALIEEYGIISRRDFAHLRLDHRRWLAAGWLRVTKEGYVADAPPDFKAQHPIVYQQIKADIDKWCPPRTLLDVPKQDALL